MVLITSLGVHRLGGASRGGSKSIPAMSGQMKGTRLHDLVRRDTLPRIIVGAFNRLPFEAPDTTKGFYSMTDRSNGYEGVAAEFLARRGCARTRSKGIGVKAVR